jgi:Fe-S cluster biogenesis protein NfuA
MTSPAPLEGPARRFADRVQSALAGLTPLLPVEHATIELVGVRVEVGEVTLRMRGGCTDCQLSLATLREGIMAHLRRTVPELRDVRSAD